MFYLVAHIPTFLDCLIFNMVSFLLHYRNGLYDFTCTLFQFFIAPFLLIHKSVSSKFIDVIDKLCILL